LLKVKITNLKLLESEFMNTSKNISLKQILRALLVAFLSFSICSKSVAFQAKNPYHEDTILVAKLLETAIKKCHHDFEGALADAHKALKIAQNHDDKSWIVKSHHRIGRIYETNNQLVQAHFYYQSELALVNQVPNNLKIDIYFDLAKVYTKSGKYAASRKNYLQVLALCEQSDNLKMKRLVFVGLGDLYTLMNDFEKAAEYNFKSIQLSQKNQDVKEECNGYRQLAALYQKANDSESSYKYANMAFNLVPRVKDTLVAVLTHFTYAKSLNLVKKHTEALMYFERAKTLVERFGDKANIAKANLYLAETFNLMGYRHKAEFHFNEAFKYISFIESNELAKLYYEFGVFNSKFVEKADVVEKSLHLALQTSLAGNHKDVIQKSYFALSELNKKKGNNTTAYTYLQAAYAYRDSLIKDENLRHTAQAQFAFDEQQVEIKLAKINREKVLIIIFSIFTLLFSGMLGMYYFMRRQKANNTILAQKNQEIEQQVQLLAESNGVLQQFAYITAHDLKEPLRSISSFVSIIKRRYAKGLPPEAGEYMNFVTDGVKRMENLLSALLEYSTVVADNTRVIQVTPLKEVVKEIIQNLHHSIEQRNAVVRYPSVLPDILMSRVHVTQLIQNLVANALKFSETQPVVEIGIKKHNDNLVIYIKDNGIGIKEEYADKIFKVFQRLDRSRAYEGTGIGLSICKSLVDKYGGKIWFESKTNEGTTFFMAFPQKLFNEIPDLKKIKMETYDSNIPLTALK
jgi:signal transduction histidine kinase